MIDTKLRQEVESLVGPIAITGTEDWIEVEIQYSGLGKNGELRHKLICATQQSKFDRAKKSYTIEEHPLNMEEMLRNFLRQVADQRALDALRS